MSNLKRKFTKSGGKAHGSMGKTGTGPVKAHGYWLYGTHAVKAALENPRRVIRRVVATGPGAQKIGEAAQRRGLQTEVKSPQELTKLLPPEAVHQGAAIEVAFLPELSVEEYLAAATEPRVLVLLDQVTDPHNVGAILRSAAAFGAGAVVVPRDHASPESAILAKASSGGIELVPVVTVTNLAQCMETLKKHGYWCIGLDGEAKATLASAKPGKKTALVLGAEGRGLRRLTAERCDLLVKLPISPAMESLNVSNAAAISLYVIAQAAANKDSE